MSPTFFKLSRSYTALLMRDSRAAETRPGSSDTYIEAIPSPPTQQYLVVTRIST
jgi:hypothetical protein